MDALVAQIQEELQQIRLIVEEITGLSSRWNGVLELVPNAEFRGKKSFSCAILMDAELAKQEIRWRTSIHELLHSVSVGYTPTDYHALLGWEEGVVEQLQRLTRPEILRRISIAVTEEVFQVWEAQHPFNRHIAALEQMRTALSLPDVLFYIGLLRTPIRDRPAYLFDLGSRLPDA